MPLIAIILIIASILTGGKYVVKTINEKIISPNKISKNIERKVYTTDEIRNSTLSDKYNINEFWNENIIEFNGHKYKVIDKDGGRMFEPVIIGSPELILTPKLEPIITQFIPSPNNFQKNQKNFNNELNYQNNNTQALTTYDPDPIIKCGKHEKCGGGYVEMRKSQCQKMVCCRIDGNYSFVTKEECDKYKTTSNNELKLVSVYLPHSGNTIKCYENISKAIFEASSAIKRHEEQNKRLEETNKEIRDMCINLCDTDPVYKKNYSYSECLNKCYNDYYSSSKRNQEVIEIDYKYLNELIEIGCP